MKIINNRISILIPARNEIFLFKTIQDILIKARGDIEVIAVLDGYWMKPDEIIEDKRVHYLHFGESRGMRNAINSAANMATGQYLLKCDAHVMFDEGFDVKLKEDVPFYEGKTIGDYTGKGDFKNLIDNWIVVPRRHRLDPENWVIKNDNRPPIDYEFLSSPSKESMGIKGNMWNERTVERMDKPGYMIDDLMTFQGSCWFMTRHHYLETLGGMSEVGYGQFIREAQEIGLKTWLSGGKCFVNKNTWYAHLHKGNTYGRMYHLDGDESKRGGAWSDDHWFNNREPKMIRDLAWLVEHFGAVPSWTPELIEQVRRK